MLYMCVCIHTYIYTHTCILKLAVFAQHCLWYSSISIHVALVDYFPLLYIIQLYKCTIIYGYTFPCSWRFTLFPMLLLETIVTLKIYSCAFLLIYHETISLGIHLAIKVLVNRLYKSLTFIDIAVLFSKVVSLVYTDTSSVENISTFYILVPNWKWSDLVTFANLICIKC